MPPASKGTWYNPATALDLTGTGTDTDSIVNTALAVNQTAGAAGATDPNQPIPPTQVTAVDGTLTAAGSVDGNTTSSRRSLLFSRDPSDYEEVFTGSGTGPNDRDASIEGTAYLTFGLVDNSTYNVDACLAFCDSVDQCGNYHS